MKTTGYFDGLANRPEMVRLRIEWIRRAINYPEQEMIQEDDRIRKWGEIPEMENRYLRVIRLEDGETVRNAFQRGL